jgi:signal transduction histidine kinase
MKVYKPRSLRRELTRQMVVMQVLVLLVFTFMAALPILYLVRSYEVLDHHVVEDIGRSVTLSDAGTMQLVPNDGLTRVMRAHPDFWFYLVDAQGRALQSGRVPDDMDSLASVLPRISSGNIADMGTERNAIIRQYRRDDLQLWIVTAGGPEIGWKVFGVAFSNPIFLGLLFFLTVASIVVIPVVVRRQLQGVDAIAAEADTIDVKQPGIRLSSERVPSELHPLVRAMNSALQRLDEGMERRQRFLADAAHELRTPIAILQTRIELLAAGPERTRLMLDVARLANLANQLLDLQRLEEGRPNFEDLDLVEVAAQVTADMAPLAIAANDEISFHSEDDSVMVNADAAAISRALTNLIQNAIVHGGKRTHIGVAVLRDGTLQVTDTGPGIPAKHREEIFEPFHRITPLDHGAGLGLNLVKDIVARHGGRVTVGDAQGGGAQFEITLPLAKRPTLVSRPAPGAFSSS